MTLNTLERYQDLKRDQAIRYLTGLAVGLRKAVPELLFDPDKPHTGCLICGTVFQSNLDRKTSNDPPFAVELRRLWSVAHAKTHTEAEHGSLLISGNWCTPEAAFKFASYGIITLDQGSEYSDALWQSKPIPTNDVEGA